MNLDSLDDLQIQQQDYSDESYKKIKKTEDDQPHTITSTQLSINNEPQVISTRPSDPLLIKLQEQVSLLKEQISTLKNELENPSFLKDKVIQISSGQESKKALLRKTVIEIVDLLKKIELSQKTIQEETEERKKKDTKGQCVFFTSSGFDLVSITATVVTSIADSKSSGSTNKNKGWEKAKYVSIGFSIFCTFITIGIGIWYKLNKDKIKKLEAYKNEDSQNQFKDSHGFNRKEINKLNKLKPFAESLANATEFLDDSSIDEKTITKRISICLKEFKKINTKTRTALFPKLQQLIATTLELLPENHPLKQNLEKIKLSSQPQKNNLKKSEILIIEDDDNKLTKSPTKKSTKNLPKKRVSTEKKRTISWSESFQSTHPKPKIGSVEKSSKLSPKNLDSSTEEEDQEKIECFKNLEKDLGCRINFLPLQGNKVINPHYNNIFSTEDDEDSSEDIRIEFDEKDKNLNNGGDFFDKDN